MSNSQKISQFTTKSVFGDSDLLTFLNNGQNFNIKFSDFKLNLGVLGQIKPVGDPLGVPILSEPSPLDYRIRNIESGKGVIASLSAQNGVKIDANFSQDQTGVTVIEDLNKENFLFRSIKANAPLQVSVENKSIVFELTESPLAATNTVIVSSIEDFPPSVSGVRTMSSNTNYIIVQPITTSDRFVWGDNCSLTANNSLTPVFTYTGLGSFFTGANTGFTFRSVRLSAPNGKVFDFSGSTAQVVGIMSGVLIDSCVSVGDFNNLSTLSVDNSGCLQCESGIAISGNTNWFNLSFSRLNIISGSSSFVGIDFGSSLHNTLELTNVIFSAPAGGVGISGLTGSGNMVYGGLATVSICEFFGGIAPLQGVSTSDVRWQFTANAGLNDSMSDVLMSYSENTSETAISSAGSKVKINAVWENNGLSRFDFDSSGTATYISERSAKLPIDVTATILTASGGDKQSELCLYINGAPIPNTCKQSTVNSSKAASVTTIWQHEFQEGDYIEIFVSNESDTTNLVVQQAILRVN